MKSIGTFVVLFSIISAVVYSSSIFALEAEKIEKFRSLNFEAANKAALGALNACRKSGYSVAVAVVDRGGNVQSLMRDNYAGPHTPETATR